jgi:hypothetical protein
MDDGEKIKKNLENKTQRVYDMVHGEKHWKNTEKRGKCEMHTIGPGWWGEN